MYTFLPLFMYIPGCVGFSCRRMPDRVYQALSFVSAVSTAVNSLTPVSAELSKWKVSPLDSEFRPGDDGDDWFSTSLTLM